MALWHACLDTGNDWGRETGTTDMTRTKLQWLQERWSKGYLGGISLSALCCHVYKLRHWPLCSHRLFISAGLCQNLKSLRALSVRTSENLEEYGLSDAG